jgi:hypothetical protein
VRRVDARLTADVVDERVLEPTRASSAIAADCLDDGCGVRLQRLHGRDLLPERVKSVVRAARDVPRLERAECTRRVRERLTIQVGERLEHAVVVDDTGVQ